MEMLEDHERSSCRCIFFSSTQIHIMKGRMMNQDFVAGEWSPGNFNVPRVFLIFRECFTIILNAHGLPVGPM